MASCKAFSITIILEIGTFPKYFLNAILEWLLVYDVLKDDSRTIYVLEFKDDLSTHEKLAQANTLNYTNPYCVPVLQSDVLV